MKLYDATLDLARFAKGTEDHTVTAISGRKITCSTLAGRVAEFGGGTIWVLSGEAAGYFGRIKASAAQVLETEETITGLAEGNQITIGAWLEFDTQKLINAVNAVLQMYKILKYNDELEFDPEADAYDLPEGVTEDIRKIYVPMTRNRTVSCHYWKVEDHQLYLYDHRKTAYIKDGPIRICYVDYHGPVGKDDEIDPQVDPLYLRYMAWLYLCRNLIQNTHKDNLISSDMYNEAKIYERDYGYRPNKLIGPKSFTFPQW